MAGRPLRRQAGAPHRDRGVHRGLGTLWRGTEHDRAGSLPGHSGRGRRHDGAGRDGHALPGLPSGRAGSGRQHPDPRDDGGSRRRAGPRRFPRHQFLVALGLLRQRADRHCGRRLRLARPGKSRRHRCRPLRRARLHPGRRRVGPLDVRGVGGAAPGVVVDRRDRDLRERRRPGWRSSWWSCGPPAPWSTSTSCASDCSARPTA